MRIRFILGLLILLLACGLQFWFSSADVFINFVLATLITFAFFFDIWELLVFVLFAIFVINWQPATSIDIFLFGIIPVAVYAFRKMFGIAPWVAMPASLIVGTAILYIGIAPGAFIAHMSLFALDLFGSLVFGSLVFLTLQRMPRS